ncbi:hypothetical protein NP233_g1887 [Leucocoprinus birnbaumii]|uniref:G domain-containing protein n=1 Tax=Leucocoprinus birnbaumii TaxID=56174 RepID=A0AAD5W554_9AGAR|nr:hypothetical protein NP233_g1887 [Leucocoprinus birnbaumii]
MQRALPSSHLEISGLVRRIDCCINQDGRYGRQKCSFDSIEETGLIAVQVVAATRDLERKRGREEIRQFVEGVEPTRYPESASSAAVPNAALFAVRIQAGVCILTSHHHRRSMCLPKFRCRLRFWKKRSLVSEQAEEKLVKSPTVELQTMSAGEAEQEPVDTRPANPTSEAGLQSVMTPPIPTGLPSQVEESLMSCPKFRIALIGKSGVGKSSLVQRFFNFDSSQVDISDHRPGEADIEREYTSSVNPRFIIHDSKGFEAGSEANWDTIESFLRRSVAYPELSRRIHAIWFCIETPRSGARLLQRGDEQLLKLAADLKIPIVAAKKGTAASPEQQALEAYEGSVEELQAASNCVTVRISMKDRNLRDMLTKLANVTRGLLHEVEGQLWITWVTAQQASAQQKVDLSISEGCKSTYIPILHLGLTTDNNASEYWLNLGQSVVFEGQIMIDCVRRIHDDILKVWNFYDPDKILSSLDFFKGMIALAEPPEKETGVRPS